MYVKRKKVLTQKYFHAYNPSMKKKSKNGHINRDLILRLRTDKKLSQRGAAKAIGVAFGTIQSAEKLGRMSMGTLQKFADFYKLPKSAFLLEG